MQSAKQICCFIVNFHWKETGIETLQLFAHLTGKDYSSRTLNGKGAWEDLIFTILLGGQTLSFAKNLFQSGVSE